eukprot:GEMP01002231.1.p1 GENE.GEMP01002231.1~~GEMP01002231.1.p1  ORF type:complete len:523 (+),score=77.60 GEMP01002231.1:2633-4201(+)
MATVQGLFLGGQHVVFTECSAVRDIMITVATEQGRFASDVVVLPTGSGEVLPHDVEPPPDVSIVLKMEETQLSKDECKQNIALHAAAGDAPTVARAITMLQRVDTQTKWPEDFLLEACDANEETTIHTLIRAGVDGCYAFDSASREGASAAVQTLLQARACVNCTDECFARALVLAAYGEKRAGGLLAFRYRGNGYGGFPNPGSHRDTVQILIDAGVDVNRASQMGMRALGMAASQGDKETVQILLDARTDVNSVNEWGYSALNESVSKETAQILLDAGADVNQVNLAGESALQVAVRRERKEVVQILLDAGADESAPTSLLIRYIWYPRIVQMLVDVGVDVNRVGQDGWSPLTYASWEGCEETVQILISAAAEVNGGDDKNGSALMYASLEGHIEAARLLIDARAEVNGVNQLGCSALMHASWNGCEEAVRLLISAGADVNHVNPLGWGALTCVIFGSEEVEQILLSAGAVYLPSYQFYHVYRFWRWARPLYASFRRLTPGSYLGRILEVCRRRQRTYVNL